MTVLGKTFKERVEVNSNCSISRYWTVLSILDGDTVIAIDQDSNEVKKKELKKLEEVDFRKLFLGVK